MVGALAGCAARPLPPAPLTTATFCGDIQAQVTGSRIPAATVVHADHEAFTLSKAQVRPLESQQYVQRAGDLPTLVSCKFKSRDHVVAEHGEAAAGPIGSCERANRATAANVLASLGSAERRRVANVSYEPDVLAESGPDWLKPYGFVRRTADGSLVVVSKSARVDWLDPATQQIPPRFRGAHYCHLIAPEYLRALLLGAAVIDPVAPPAGDR